jgi:hypothetical protein
LDCPPFGGDLERGKKMRMLSGALVRRTAWCAEEEGNEDVRCCAEKNNAVLKNGERKKTFVRSLIRRAE